MDEKDVPQDSGVANDSNTANNFKSTDESNSSSNPKTKDSPSKLQFFLRVIGKSFLIALGLVSIATYIYFCPPVLTKMHSGFILFPFPPGEEYNYDTVANVKREEVYFKNPNGSKLHGFFFQSKDATAPVVLFSHGNAGNIGHRLLLAKWILDAGASVLLFDYRNYGKSEGVKDLNGLKDDSRAAYDYLTKERKIPANKIILYGESIGGGPTCILSQNVPSEGIILDSTFTSLLQIGRKKIAFFYLYPDFCQPDPPLNNLEILKGKHSPLLIIHGAKDEIIPVSEANQNFAEASEPKELLILPQSTHNTKELDADAYVEGLRRFFTSLKKQESN